MKVIHFEEWEDLKPESLAEEHVMLHLAAQNNHDSETLIRSGILL